MELMQGGHVPLSRGRTRLAVEIQIQFIFTGFPHQQLRFIPRIRQRQPSHTVFPQVSVLSLWSGPGPLSSKWTGKPFS